MTWKLTDKWEQPRLRPDSNNPSFVEQFGNGVTREWIEEGWLVVHKVVLDDQGEAIDAWEEMVRDTLDLWPSDVEYRALDYFPNLSPLRFSNEVQDRFISLAFAAGNARGRAAVVLPRTFVTMATRIFFNTTLRHYQPYIQRRIFVRTASGLLWLQSQDNATTS